MKLISMERTAQRNLALLKKVGISLFPETRLNHVSRKLPLGHALPQTHRPLKNPPKTPTPMAPGTTKPNKGNLQPRAITVIMIMPRSHLQLKPILVEILHVAGTAFM